MGEGPKLPALASEPLGADDSRVVVGLQLASAPAPKQESRRKMSWLAFALSGERFVAAESKLMNSPVTLRKGAKLSLLPGKPLAFAETVCMTPIVWPGVLMVN